MQRKRRNRVYRMVQILLVIFMMVYMLISTSIFGSGEHRTSDSFFRNSGGSSRRLIRSRNNSQPERQKYINDSPLKDGSVMDENIFGPHGDEEYKRMSVKSAAPPWKRFLDEISLDEMYPRPLPQMRDLLLYMERAPIVNVTAFKRGTQLKLLMRFEDGKEVIAKPMRHPRDFYWAYNRTQPFWMDEERHTAEIAAFHLDSILGFRRVIPCVGRKVDFTAEILRNTDDPEILDTLTKIGGRNCIVGKCVPWFCNEDKPICDRDGFLELAMCFRVPSAFHFSRNPWSQGQREAELWRNKNTCKKELKNPDNLKGRFFLDIMEVALFDHLIVNYDRHHHAQYTGINTEKSCLVINDNGKGFGNPHKDDLTFLAPIYQCCRFRNSTYQHLLTLSNRLGDLMRASLSTDLLAPILTDPFFPALDRRLNQFFFVMEKCLEAHGSEVVLVEKLTMRKPTLPFRAP